MEYLKKNFPNYILTLFISFVRLWLDISESVSPRKQKSAKK